MPSTNTTALITTIINAMPSIIATIKSNHAASNPDAPRLTDADVFAALNVAVAESVAKDEAWKKAHPDDAPGTVTDSQGTIKTGSVGNE